MKISTFLFGILLLLSACSSGGNKVSVAHLDVHYDGNLNDEAYRLGSYLFDANYGMNEKEAVIRLSQSEGRYIVRFIVSEDEMSLERSWRLQGENISKFVFNGAPVDIDLCDSKFNSLKFLPGE